ncbi:di-trans,poly-cis-decaprenylcistransferase [Candidatus Bathyarchaeota archaeon]|nr:di-trans,poly-cis-decaprenylcistransferase [Candidatus Bathyarchaeota archaeon]
MLKTLLSLLGVYKIYEKWLWQQVKNQEKPEHIAIILDGNRRWAQEHSLEPWIGHYYGADKAKDVLKWCLDLDVKTITLYAFSTENFQRSKEEVERLMQLFKKKLQEVIKSEEIHKHRVRVKVIGRINLLPQDLQEMIKTVEEETKNYDERFLNIAIAYGGRAEIVDAARKIAQEVAEGKLSPNDIDEKIFEQYLYTSFLPKQDPDLIIRTSGEERLSGFLLYQSAYSELCFLDVYWPEFRRIDLLRAIRTYQKRKRKFGR